jgi:hypothetical protein
MAKISPEWGIPVIPATQEVKMGGSWFEASKKVIPCLKKQYGSGDPHL